MSRTDFSLLVDTHGAEIHRYLRRLVRDSARADDCFQEAFLRAQRAYPRLPAGANHRAWLYRIATNTARSWMARHNRQLARTADLDPGLAADDPMLEEALDRHRQLQAVGEAVQRLPAKQREALILRKFQELDYRTIGDVLGCSVESARANVYQAVKKLRSQFKAQARRRG